ncbi:ead/Ea22-like family protein [Klebsiella aerogenes]
MTTDITELAQSLKAAAENATPGEWCSDDQYGIVADAGLNGNYYIASCSGPEHRQNKRFIALANPANVIALVEALEKAQQQIQTHERAELTWMNALELPDDATRNDILPAIHAGKYTLRAANKRIGELESRTVTVTVPHSSEAELVADRCNRHRAAKLRSGNATSEDTDIKVEAE